MKRQPRNQRSVLSSTKNSKPAKGWRKSLFVLSLSIQWLDRMEFHFNGCQQFIVAKSSGRNQTAVSIQLNLLATRPMHHGTPWGGATLTGSNWNINETIHTVRGHGYGDSHMFAVLSIHCLYHHSHRMYHQLLPELFLEVFVVSWTSK